MTFRLSIRLPLALLVAIAPASLPAQGNGSDFARDLDAYVTKAVKDWNVPDLAIAVVHKGQLLFAKGYGVRDVGKPEPVDTQTIFAIASTTKAITAAALGMLIDEGKVRWDDPVIKYVPTFQMYDSTLEDWAAPPIAWFGIERGASLTP